MSTTTTKSRIAIIGTGLIGTSIGLNLTARKDRTYEVVGADRDRSHARHAKKMGAIDREVDSLEEAVENAGLVVIAVPVMQGHPTGVDRDRCVQHES